MFGWMLKKVLGNKHEREVKKIQPMVDAIAQQEDKFAKLSDAELKARTATFREKLDNGATLDDILIPAFATMREAGKRVLGMRHYDVQMVGGIVLHQGRIAEMRTGEGKTLVATLPCYLNGLGGKGVHVVTVNDYLARRDAEWMGQVHAFLGLSTGVVLPQMSNAAKKRAYAADITYGQNNEFGFDYMRDNMKFSIYDYVQRDLNFAIVDEVDSILIDEARTPLIISGPGSTASEKYEKISELVPKLRRDEHFELDEKARNVALTEEGMEFAQQLLSKEGLLKVADGGGYREAAQGNLYDPANLETLHILQQSLRAHTLYHRDRNYMVGPKGKILIIDEFTGRTLPGRRWSDGLHQAVEAKERVPIQDENITLATISFQNLFRLYRKLSGMTGTADTEATEFHKIYELDVLVIPTNKPIARLDQEDLVYKSEREKFIAVAEEIESVNSDGRPILVGTTSVEKSDALSRLLTKRGIHHEVLNAKQHEREAYIVAQAGTAGAVTVATNMAGRGTDIVLGGNAEMLARMDTLQNASDELREDKEAFEKAVEEAEEQYEARCKAAGKDIKGAGGLHIIGTERHESRRVDNQLRGRAGRQGDPGSSRFFLSLEDDLMRIFAGDRVQRMMDTLGMEEGEPIEHRWVTKAVENAQKKVEERNFDIRKHLLEYDDVMNQQRKSVYELRKQVLQGKYQTVLTDEEHKKGLEPEPLVEDVEEELLEKALPILEQMVKIHAADPPPQGATPEEIEKFRKAALKADMASLGTVKTFPLERDIYSWFGTVVDVPDDAKGEEVYELVVDAVGLALTMQKERMLDMVDELIGASVEIHCPPGKHHEDWNVEALEDEFEIQFEMDAPDLSSFGTATEIAAKLYQDAENVLLKKMEALGPANYLRLFRNFYLQEIDQQWIENLQAMDQLRDGIGLRGYGQRDPKREYKREGFRMFQEMMRSIKANVATRLYTVQQAREEDLQKLEAQRRRDAEERQRQANARHAGDENTAAPGVQTSGKQPRGQRPPARRQGGGGGGAAPRQEQQAPEQKLNRKQRRALAKKKKQKGKDARP